MNSTTYQAYTGDRNFFKSQNNVNTLCAAALFVEAQAEPNTPPLSPKKQFTHSVNSPFKNVKPGKNC